MRVTCTNGFYEFMPTHANELKIFEDVFDDTLVLRNGVFIPSAVDALDDVNFQAEVVGEIPCVISTYNKKDLFELNELTYNLQTKAVVSQLAISDVLDIGFDGRSYGTKNIIQCGAFNGGSKVTSFIGTYDFNNFSTEFLE